MREVAACRRRRRRVRRSAGNRATDYSASRFLTLSRRRFSSPTQDKNDGKNRKTMRPSATRAAAARCGTSGCCCMLEVAWLQKKSQERKLLTSVRSERAVNGPTSSCLVSDPFDPLVLQNSTIKYN